MMGEEQFTDDERIILGEIEAPEVEQTPEEPTEPTEPETEPEPEAEPEEPKEPETEEELEPEEPRIPQKQYDKIYGKAKDLERKHELLRSNPEEYYRQYPSEKPQAPAVTTSKIPEEYRDVQVEGGKYNGMTLETVWKIDPSAAISLLSQADPIKAMDLHYEMKEEQRQAESKKQDSVKESQREIDTFSESLAKELYEKPFEQLADKERQAIEGEVKSIIQFMQATHRGGGILADAYYLMHRDKELAAATKKGADGIVRTLTKDRPKSVASSKSGSAKNVYDDFLSSTPQELAGKIDKMSDADYKAFIKGAPAELKDKFPGIIWE